MTNLDIWNLIHHFWLDHLEIFWTFKDENLFEKLDFDNSNNWKFDDYEIIKSEVYKYSYKIIFSKWWKSLFAYYKWKTKTKKQPVATRDYIVSYWTAFKLLEYEEVLWFLEWHVDLLHCRRFDICIDLKINIDELLNNHFKEYKTWRNYRKGWKTETRYFWELKNSKNKRQLIRVYDKIKDIYEKNKIDLYQDYLTFPNITRLELEVRQELAKEINYSDVFNNNILIWILKNYLRKHTEIFNQFENDKISLYRTKNLILSNEEYQSLFYKTWRLNYFLWCSKTIYELWFCPVRVLIENWYIQDKTKISLWIENINDVIHKEIKAKNRARDNKYFRNNIEEILSNYYKYGS